MTDKMDTLDRFQGYFQHYIGLSKHMDMKEALLSSHTDIEQLIQPLTEEKLDFAYAEDKWSIKELLLHLADCERVFQYRALSFSRGDTTDLLGFDHDAWVPASKAGNRTKQDLLEELKNLRLSSINLFDSMDEEQLDKTGSANGNVMSARAVAFIISGHSIHHTNILRERYLNS